MSDNINHPSHYEAEGIECIDAMELTQGREAVKDFCLCNAYKYLWRHKKKNGLEDLKKARWYLDRYITMQTEDDKAVRAAIKEICEDESYAAGFLTGVQPVRRGEHNGKDNSV